MDLKLKDQRVLVTGASRGIGLTIALAFARAGAQPILVARNQDNLDKALARFAQAGHAAPQTVLLDLAVSGSSEALGEQVGEVDILVNNAGAIPGGDIEAVGEARWREAAQKGRAEAFIATLPGGYRTQLGKWFKEGRELSGGQWQKIALSRAFMRTSADILVLDEPTAAMDAQAEAEIFAHFRELARDKIAILISHRFSTVRMADHIAVISAGRITEQGDHASLMAQDGVYARLFSLQAQGYR